MSSEQVTTISLHDKQYDAYHFKTQFGLCVCGVQSGKTFVGAAWSGKKIEEFPTKNGLIFAPTYKILQHATLDKFFTLFPEYRRYYKEQKGVIELPEGGKVFIRSADEPLGVEGMTIHWAWGDEAGMMKRLMWLVVKARVSTTGGQIFLTTTPYDMGWMYQELFLPWKDGTDKDVSVYTWKSVENPYFPEEYYEKERLRLTPEEFAKRYEGEFTRLEGLIWPLPRDQIVYDSPQLEVTLRYPDGVYGAIDWGFNHPCGIVIGVVKDAVWYVVEEWKESGKTTPEILTKAKELEHKWKVSMWFPDPAEPDRIEEMKRHPYNMHVGVVDKSDVEAGLSHVAGLIKARKLFVHSRCKDLIDEMEQYQFEPDQEGKPGKEKPLKINDDLCDALRYMCYAYRPADPVAVRRLMVERFRRKAEGARKPYEFQ